MKKLYPILLILLLFTVKSEKIEYNFRYITNYNEYSAFYNSKVNLLSAKYSGSLLSLTKADLRTSVYTSLLNKNIIIDTTVVGYYRKNGSYFIKTQSRTLNNLLCELKCDKSRYNELSQSNNTHFLLAVKVNSIQSHQRVIELDSIDDKSYFVKNGNDVVINGDCLDAVELPYQMIFSND
jgi:hypothetical protein